MSDPVKARDLLLKGRRLSEAGRYAEALEALDEAMQVRDVEDDAFRGELVRAYRECRERLGRP